MLAWVASSCFLILAVLVLRAMLGRKISARFRYALWALVLVRLLVPVQLYTSPVAGMSISVGPGISEKLEERSIYVLPVEDANVWIEEDGRIGDASSFGYPKLSGDGAKIVRYADRISPLQALKILWCSGSIASAAILLVSNLRFAARLRRVRRPMEGTACRVPVYRAEGLPSPCLFGVLRPAVYVTARAAENPSMLRHVLAHELTHYRHLDHIWSVLRGIALAVHWWNPLVWLAVVCSRRDGELACDEGALKMLDRGERAAYGETLLALVTAEPSRSKLHICLYILQHQINILCDFIPVLQVETFFQQSFDKLLLYSYPCNITFRITPEAHKPHSLFPIQPLRTLSQMDVEILIWVVVIHILRHVEHNAA